MPHIPQCSFVGCESSNNNISFFKYPINHIERCQKWVKASNNPKIETFFKQNLRQLRLKTVCEKHFKLNEIIVHKNRKQLISTSVPNSIIENNIEIKGNITENKYRLIEEKGNKSKNATQNKDLVSKSVQIIEKKIANHKKIENNLETTGNKNKSKSDTPSNTFPLGHQFVRLKTIEESVNHSGVHSDTNGFDSNANEHFTNRSFNSEHLFKSSFDTQSEKFLCLKSNVIAEKPKRKSLTIEEKIEIIGDFDDGMKRSDILNKYSLADYSSLNSILKKRDQIINNSLFGNFSIKRKRMREGKYSEIEREMTLRIDECIESDIPITGSLIQDIARDVAKDMNVLDFKASNGWLMRYKKRMLLLPIVENKNKIPTIYL